MVVRTELGATSFECYNEGDKFTWQGEGGHLHWTLSRRIDRYEESQAIPANPKGPELARKARLAVNKASQSDPASAGDLEILLTHVSIINLDHMKMILGGPAPLEADTAKYRKLRDDLLKKLKKKPAITRPAKSS